MTKGYFIIKTGLSRIRFSPSIRFYLNMKKKNRKEFQQKIKHSMSLFVIWNHKIFIKKKNSFVCLFFIRKHW